MCEYICLLNASLPVKASCFQYNTQTVFFSWQCPRTPLNKVVALSLTQMIFYVGQDLPHGLLMLLLFFFFNARLTYFPVNWCKYLQYLSSPGKQQIPWIFLFRNVFIFQDIWLTVETLEIKQKSTMSHYSWTWQIKLYKMLTVDHTLQYSIKQDFVKRPAVQSNCKSKHRRVNV